MKFIATITLLIISYSSFSQITLSEVLGFQIMPFKEIQSYLFKKYTIINDEVYHYYEPITKCMPPEYEADSCTWSCYDGGYEESIHSKFPLYKVEFKNPSIVNYIYESKQKSTFAENYDAITKKATSFIEICEMTYSMNDNCENELHNIDIYCWKGISIQFNDLEEWKRFKNNVIEKATFIGTSRIDNNSPIKFNYEIKIQLKNGKYKKVEIELYENNLNYHASIRFYDKFQGWN